MCKRSKTQAKISVDLSSTGIPACALLREDLKEEIFPGRSVRCTDHAHPTKMYAKLFLAIYDHLERSRHVVHQLHMDRIFAYGLDGFSELYPPLVDLEPLRRERFGQIIRGYRTKELPVFSRFARKDHRGGVQQFCLL